MNELVNVIITNEDGVNVVSSRDIAEGLGKQHKDVLKALDVVIKSIGENVRPLNFIPSQYLDSRNRTKREYLLTKDGFILYMFNIQGHNDFKMAYINKFNEMEKQLTEVRESYMIQDPIERAKRWIKEEEVRLEQARLLEEQAPKVQTYDMFIDKEHTLGFRELRKEVESVSGLTIKEKDFKELLSKLKITTEKSIKASSEAIRKGWAQTKDIDTPFGTTTQDRFTILARDVILDYIEENNI